LSEKSTARQFNGELELFFSKLGHFLT